MENVVPVDRASDPGPARLGGEASGATDRRGLVGLEKGGWNLRWECLR